MSQYSPPYQPPQPQFYGYVPPLDLAGPARRAGLLMVILGVLTLLAAGCVGSMGMIVQKSDLPPDVQGRMSQIESEVGVDMATMFKVAGVFVAAPGLVMVVLGLFVRRGGLVSAILGVIVTAVALLYFAAMVLQGVVVLAQGNLIGSIGPIFFAGVGLALFGLQMAWLIKALKNAGPLKAFNQHQQAYAWQMQQQMYAQQQQYRYPPPPPPPPPAG